MAKLKFNPHASVILVDVKLSARFSIIGRLVLDTGASYVVLPWKLADAIGVRIDPKKFTHTTTATAVETVPEITIPQMTVLGKTIRNVEAIVKNLPPSAPVDGLLGLSFLKHFKLQIDFVKGELILD